MYLVLILLSFLTISCGHHHHFGTNASNQHMHKKSHAELIKAFDDPARDGWQKPQDVLKLMGHLKDKKLIEIGAGSGYFTKYFFKAGGEVIAADVDKTFLEHIQKTLPQVQTKKIPFDDPEMESNSFDVAFTSNTYHHIDERVA
jgi:ubiquinone/menaquinone biosynthesis C-methylase UbiE